MSKKTKKLNVGEGLDQDLTDWGRLKKLRNEEIDSSDIPELDENFFNNAEVVMPPEKRHVSIRLDADVLEWMKGQGKGYQSRINAILRAYYEAHRGNNRDAK
jgi:uncharacterized protein (DUF4415 family)